MWKKIVKASILWILIGLTFPIIKTFYDSFTAPLTGLLIANADDWTLAIITGIPWILPLIIFVMTIVYLLRPDPEEDKTRGRTIILR